MMGSDVNGEFDFKPINEGLGFHRKVKPLDAEVDSDESFSFSTLGPGTLAKPKVEANSREQSKGLLSSSTSQASGSQSTAKSKHNAKSVSDLISALPPSLDFFVDESTTRTDSKQDSKFESKQDSKTLSSSGAPSAATLRKSPLFSSPGGIATPGAPAAASMIASEAASERAASEKAAEKERALDAKRGFLKLPLGRNDYGMKPKTSLAASAAILAASAAAGAITGRSPSSLDENIAKTFPTVFPHLGSLAGQSAVKPAASKPALTDFEIHSERPIATHFGSAVLDTLVSVGFGCVLLAISLSVTDVNLLALLENSQTDRETIISLALMFVAGGLLYVLAARSFLGATLGEWSYEIRVGEHQARKRWFYPALVMWRGMLVAATGFIIFPLISLIAGRDVLKYLTGLELVGVDGAAPASADE
jgi:hypothetical protein